MKGINMAIFEGFIDVLRLIKHRLFFDPRKIDRVLDRVDTIYEVLKATNDITKVQKATGMRRLSQVANAKLLKRVTDILDKNGIPYWLDFGTLIGAIRHGGSIPWDDDIDISVLRASYVRIAEILRTEGFVVTQSDNIRVLQDGLPCQIDIFPFDEYHVSAENQKRFYKEYLSMCRSVMRDYSKLFMRERIVTNFSDEEISEAQKRFGARYTGDRRILLGGFECGFHHTPAREWNWVFPLKKVSYEGYEFSCPNKPDIVAYSVYGDFMSFPPSIHSHEDVESRGTLDAYEKLKEISME